jgi:hypothetical protein
MNWWPIVGVSAFLRLQQFNVPIDRLCLIFEIEEPSPVLTDVNNGEWGSVDVECVAD